MYPKIYPEIFSNDTWRSFIGLIYLYARAKEGPSNSWKKRNIKTPRRPPKRFTTDNVSINY